MDDLLEDLRKDFKVEFSKSNFEDVEYLILMALESEKELSDYKGWSSSFVKEKHDALNYSYHISLRKDNGEGCFDDEIEVSFYTGIDVGCALEYYSLDGCSMTSTPNMVRVLYDLSLDFSLMNINVNKDKAQLMFNNYKEDIIDTYNKQGYDNFVTGGGTSKTNGHYKDLFKKYHDMGFFWVCEYREEEFDRYIV